MFLANRRRNEVFVTRSIMLNENLIRENSQFDYFDGVPHGRKNSTDCNK